MLEASLSSLTLGSLFDGISGFALAGSWCGIETKWISEIDPYCLKISKQNFPYAKRYKDIRQIGKGRKYEPEPVTIISGGFPCQPFSVAGQRRGKEDDRYLWPEMLRVISEVRPSWVIGENVGGLLSMEQPESIVKMESEDIVCKEAEMVLETIRRDLAGIGYESQPIVIPACALNAPHRRDRVWIIAYSNGNADRQQGKSNKAEREWTIIQEQRIGKQYKELFHTGFSLLSWPLANSYSIRQYGRTERGNIGKSWQEANEQFKRFYNLTDRENLPQPGISGGHDGIPNRVDRLKALGNAIVPQVALEIFKAIIQVEMILQAKTRNNLKRN